MSDYWCELYRLRERETQLLLANNAELQRRRGFEDEANQAHCELILLRNECIRLRELNSVLSGFIERTRPAAPYNAVPEEVAQAIDAVFPLEVAALMPRGDGTRVQHICAMMDTKSFSDYLIANLDALSKGIVSAIAGGYADEVVASIGARINADDDVAPL